MWKQPQKVSTPPHPPKKERQTEHQSRTFNTLDGSICGKHGGAERVCQTQPSARTHQHGDPATGGGAGEQEATLRLASGSCQLCELRWFNGLSLLMYVRQSTGRQVLRLPEEMSTLHSFTFDHPHLSSNCQPRLKPPKASGLGLHRAACMPPSALTAVTEPAHTTTLSPRGTSLQRLPTFPKTTSKGAGELTCLCSLSLKLQLRQNTTEQAYPPRNGTEV